MNTLKIGDKIPAFECLDNTGNTVNSDDFKSKKLIVFFYPRAIHRGALLKHAIYLTTIINLIKWVTTF